MKTFRLDEDIACKKLEKQCNASGLTQVRRQRFHDKGRKDPDWVPSVLARDEALVSCNIELIDETEGKIPCQHPGIVIVENAIPGNDTYDWREALKMLARVKAACPNWHQEWRNCVIYISQVAVKVGHIESGRFVKDMSAGFSESDWATRFETAIRANQDDPPLLDNSP